MLDRCKRVCCSRCPELVKTRKRIVPGYGKPDSAIMLVGLAPGRNGADKTGIPFTGDPSGRLLQEAMILSGLSRESEPTLKHPRLIAFVTNIVKCNPQDSTGRNRPPTREEIKNCTEYLMEELDLIRPELVVALGRTVWEQFARGNLSALIRRLRMECGTRIVHAYHPGYSVRGGGGHLPRERYPTYFRNLIRTARTLQNG